MSKHFALIVTLTCLLSLSSCTPTLMVKRSGMRLCGQMLIEALMMVCDGNFYGPDQAAKRETNEEGAMDLFSGSYPQLSRRQLQGVANECCQNPCSFSDLASYCGK